MKRAIFLVVAACVACLAWGWWSAHAAAAPLAAEDWAAIDKLRDEAKALVLQQETLSWKRRTTGENVDVAATYAGHEQLFSTDTLLLLTRALTATPDQDRRKALEFFRAYVLGEMAKSRAAKLTDEINNYLAGAEFSYRGKTYRYYEYDRLARDEADYDARQTLSDAVLPILAEANKRLAQKESRLQEAAKELGERDYVALSQELRPVRLDDFAPVCQRFLDETEREFRAAQEWAVPFQLGIPAAKLRRADLPRLQRNARFEKYFGKDEMLPRLRDFLAGLGLSLDKIKIDDADRPKKNPRAACYPLLVPSDVRLTFKPTGGQSDYKSLWHEMGHAQHFANATVKEWEFQQLGDAVVTENYAFLFDGMMANRRFLQRYLKMAGDDLANGARFAAYLKLFAVRRYCAKTLYELELHRGAANAKERYRGWLARAYGFPLDDKDAERYLIDVDDFFYGADYVRAWFLEAMLSRRLASTYGDDWFVDKRAGAFLTHLWEKGQYYRGDELAKTLGYTRITPMYLIERVKEQTKP
jgi:hypothetical protein